MADGQGIMLPDRARVVFSSSVEPVSNLHPPRDFGDGSRRGDRHGGGENCPDDSPILRPAQRSEIHGALQIILASNGRLAGEEQVVDFLRFAMYRGINLNDTWVASVGNRLLWAILPVVSPGRTMLLFAPTHVPPTLKDTTICPLVDRILHHFRDRGVDLAQVLLDPAERSGVALFEACGFERLAELIYLDRDVRKPHAAPLPAGFTWETYSPANHARFAETIAATYVNSLDCPLLNGKRQIEDVIAGHKASGDFDPHLWSLLLDRGRPVGVALLNRSPRTDGVELVYVGLVPAARSHGLGDRLIEQALMRAASVGARRLSLAVDANNLPALKLYRRHGMSRVCSRLALMRDLRTRAPHDPATLGSA